MSQTDWNNYFIRIAMEVASKSKDRSTKVGAVIVGPDHEIRSTGFNGFPRGIDDDDNDRHTRPAKYAWTEHAERNAIYNAARCGVSTNGCIMYLNWEPAPCSECSRAIIQAGITTVVGPDITFGGVGHGTMYDKEAIGPTMLRQAGVNIYPIPQENDPLD